MDLKIALRALDPLMIEAWHEVFADIASVQYQVRDILASNADAIVSPANSFGYMDGGIDLAYRGYFGPDIEARLQEHIRSEYHGELPVGQAVVIETQHDSIPFLVSAPTMRVPGSIENTVNVYLAFRAALLAIRQHNLSATRAIHSVLSPAFGTGVGGMDYRRAARQMRAAYRAVVLNERDWVADARSVRRHHHDLLR